MTTASATKLEGNQVQLEVEVPPEQVREGIEAKVRELGEQVRIPGFRPGKAPRPMIENHLGRDYIYTEALQESLPNWYSEALIESGVRPIDRPEINFEQPMSEEEGFKFSATVPVRPEASLGEYKGLEVPRREAEIPEDQVEEQLEELRGQFATLAAVEERPVQEGDFVILDFRGERMSDGQPVEGGEAQDYMLEVGGGDFPEDFEQNLVGMSAGERKQFGVTFPMDHEQESLRGLSVLFHVHVKEIKERDLPELDDEFAKEASEFETLDELREGVQEQLGQQLEQQVEGEFRGRVLDEVSSRAEVEVPEPLIDEKAEEMVTSFERSIRSQGIEPEQYYQLAGASREDLKTNVREDAADTARKELVLDAVVQAEGIEADQETVMHEVGHLAEELGRSVEEVAEALRENGQYAMLEEETARQRALELIAESAVAVEMPAEEESEEAVTVAEGGEESESSEEREERE